MKIEVFDSTLRDGAQGMGVSFTIKDKIQIIHLLDSYGIDFAEAGNPNSNIKDAEFFKKAKNLNLKNTKIVAFGSTRRKSTPINQDFGVRALLEAETEYVTIFGKCSAFHTEYILKVSQQENIEMVAETIEYLISHGKKVFFDAEHFFDGYKTNPIYATKVIRAAEMAGATEIVLCDTNGGNFPSDIFTMTKQILSEISIPVAIHAHNDTDCATANTIAAVNAGATQIQGAFLGIGERCGNANLSILIPNLQLKLGYNCIPDISKTTEITVKISEISNIKLPDNLPYIGKSAFTHKAGMHIDGVLKNPNSFEHVSPELVGNQRNLLLSEAAGKAVLFEKLRKIAPELQKDSVEIMQIIELIKQQEFRGYTFESAEASFELLVLKYLGKLRKFFDIEFYRINTGKDNFTDSWNVATVKVKVKSKSELAAAEGLGPVNAIDKALRQALCVFYPKISKMFLTDFKVRIFDSAATTAASTRVLLESSDGNSSWTTIGVSEDIIEAATEALNDSFNYYLVNFA